MQLVFNLVLSLALLVVAVIAALSNLWADYQDSTTWTYLSIGIPALVVALASVAVVGYMWS